ncbi:murein L,D-transpeptidase catalytic domain family protein [Flavihumibacter sp. R14]|nr:murein L,D-transpeptidase catalytic domain family protein [Flavihumibacter soli]
MKKQSFWILALLFLVTAFTAISWISVKENTPSEITDQTLIKVSPVLNDVTSAEEQFEQHISGVYNATELGKSQLDYEVFKKAFIGYLNLKAGNLVSEKPLLTIVDFNKRSSEKRLWIIDLANQKLLFNTLVAHGQGSGGDVPDKFSNLPNSHQSSLGFYVTSEIYQGKHGLSMKLDGMDKGFNTNAKERAVVIHGAEYVSEQFVSQHGRLGRSHGCPALPVELTGKIIDNIKGRTCLFIAGPQAEYTSQYTDKALAMNGFLASIKTI